MRAFLENAGLLVMLVIAATAVVKFRARRYLIVLITGTAVGAWLIGYAFGARSAAETLYPFVQLDRIERARAVLENNLPSPLWGLALGVLIIVLDYLAFGRDVRKNSRDRGARGSDRDPSHGSHAPGVDAERLMDPPQSVPAPRTERLHTGEGA